MARERNGQFTFRGFDRPVANWFRMPVEWINITANIDNLAELKVVEYILRHTWGYQEYGLLKRITIDEFIRGRKRRDGSRIDQGTGLSEQSVRNGLGKALEHGLIEEITDASDRARVKKFYGLRMRPDAIPVDEPIDNGEILERGGGVQTLDPGAQTLDLDPLNIGPRTEIDTRERYLEERNTISKEIQKDSLHKINTDLQRYEKLRLRTNVDNSSESASSADDLPGPTPAPGGMAKLAEVLKERSPLRSVPAEPSVSRRGRPPKAPDYLAATMEDVSFKLHDAQPRSSLTRATKLWKSTGLPEDKFVQRLYEARSITQQQGSVSKRADGAPGVINRAPYFFAVLEDLLGLREGREA